ncbi:MAG: ribosomal-protein-alanine N-acetyltransferase [Bacteroidia bacterium]|jgi:ribosomal-protein-alanine N-acetyltransferase
MIEKAKTSHFLKIAELDREAWSENIEATFIPDGEHAWRLWVEHALVFVAISNSEISGAVLAFPCLDGSFCLHKVFVDRTHRGKGIGSLLFDVLLQRIDELKVDIFLTVDPMNEAAISLYEKWGFTEREFVKGYYRPSEDRFELYRMYGKL